MRIIKVFQCAACPYRHTEVSGGIAGEWEWYVCTMKKSKKIEDAAKPLKTDFPKWCPLEVTWED